MAQSVNRIMQKRYGFNPKAMLSYNRLPDIFKKKAMDRYLEMYEEPENEKGYDFNILYQMALQEQSRVTGEVKATDPNPID